MAANPDGTVGPKGHPQELSLAGSGRAAGRAAKGGVSTDVVAAQEKPGKDSDGNATPRGVTLGWPGQLATPILSGTTATYTAVKPGVDLVVDARRTGFEEHLVVASRAALAGLTEGTTAGAPVSWQIPVKTNGLTARPEQDGSVSFVAADGTVASKLTAPVAFDATVDPHTGDHPNVSPVAMTVTQQGNGRAVLTLTPDQGWLSDPARVFPVTIDPTYASNQITATFDTYVSSTYSTAAYASSTELKVGTYNGGSDITRTYLNFPNAMRGQHVMSAQLNLYEVSSWSCTARSVIAYGVGYATSGTTWASQPSADLTRSDTSSFAKGYTGCGAGWVAMPLTSVMQGLSAWSSPTIGVMLQAGSESDNYAYKKFSSTETAQDPYITYTYDRAPNVATAPTLQSPPNVAYFNPGDSSTKMYTSDSTPLVLDHGDRPGRVECEVHGGGAQRHHRQLELVEGVLHDRVCRVRRHRVVCADDRAGRWRRVLRACVGDRRPRGLERDLVGVDDVPHLDRRPGCPGHLLSLAVRERVVDRHDADHAGGVHHHRDVRDEHDARPGIHRLLPGRRGLRPEGDHPVQRPEHRQDHGLGARHGGCAHLVGVHPVPEPGAVHEHPVLRVRVRDRGAGGAGGLAAGNDHRCAGDRRRRPAARRVLAANGQAPLARRLLRAGRERAVLERRHQRAAHRDRPRLGRGDGGRVVGHHQGDRRRHRDPGDRAQPEGAGAAGRAGVPDLQHRHPVHLVGDEDLGDARPARLRQRLPHRAGRAGAGRVVHRRVHDRGHRRRRPRVRRVPHPGPVALHLRQRPHRGDRRRDRGLRARLDGEPDGVGRRLRRPPGDRLDPRRRHRHLPRRGRHRPDLPCPGCRPASHRRHPRCRDLRPGR
ncbi:DNRLRE domain-containing protein [Nostocoides sp. HKS02]|nr:DNRLRE domain-containing protein [Tetrasphaera sp. HKS02]